MVTKLETIDDLRDFVATSDLTLVDFYATWCNPCRMLAPILEELSEEGVVKIGKIDTDDNSDAASNYKVNGLPTVIFFKTRHEVHRTVGVRTKKEFQELIDEFK